MANLLGPQLCEVRWQVADLRVMVVNLACIEKLLASCGFRRPETTQRTKYHLQYYY